MAIEIDHIVILTLCFVALYGWRRVLRRWWNNLWMRSKERIRRRWLPKSPEDCPYCRSGIEFVKTQVKREVVPWDQVKDRRGRKKWISTEGYACPNPGCMYHGITDADKHALVGYGHVDEAKQI